jgi:hypothetical protein
MLEDVPEEAELVRRELQKAGLAFLVRRVQTKAAFAESLEEFAPDLVLADSRTGWPGSLRRYGVRCARQP